MTTTIGGERTIVSADLEREFDLGVQAAKDPTNEAALQGGQAVTTVRSRWFFKKCVVSQHTFRSGDVVEISASGEVRLAAAEKLLELERPGATVDESPTQDGVEDEFFTGLWETWPPPADLQVVRLAAGNPLVVGHARFPRRKCAVCGHSLRPGDLVIICPCSPQQPLCESAIHRDPIHGLHCWENWNPESRRTHCPITSRKLDE